MNAFKLLKNSFKKEKGFGLLNIFGLSVGMTMSLLIIWYLQYQTSFESHIPEAGKIYRVISKDKGNGQLSFGNPLPLAKAIHSDYPGVGEVAALSPSNVFPVTVGDLKYDINASTASMNIFEMLDTDFLMGSGKTALLEPGSSVISQSCAQKLFGQEIPIGQVFKMDTFGGEKIFTVKGIIKDPPVNSEFQAEMYLSWETMNPPDWEKYWWWSGTHIIVKVLNEVQKTDLEQKINTILDRHEAPYVNGRFDFQLIPLKDSHFRTDIVNALATPVSSRLIWMLAIVAVFIIVIACINFVNLAIGQSEKNAKGTGICKVLGASRMKLAINFLTVTFLKAIIAMVIAVEFASLLFEPFQKLTFMRGYNPFEGKTTWIVLFGMVVLSGLLSGLYPAVIITRPKPIDLLSNQKSKSQTQYNSRKLLVVMQFSISIFLIIAVLFISKQILFMKNHSLGFNKEGLVAINISSLENRQDEGALQRKVEVLEQEISKRASQNGILALGATEAIPGDVFKNGFTVYNPDNLNTYTVVAVGIDENFSDVVELPVIEGRNFSNELVSDKGAILINETLKRLLGWSSIENKQLAIFTKDFKVNVIGVFKDMNINSLNQDIPPMIYRYKENAYPQYLIFRAKPEQISSSLSLVKTEWEKISDGKPFNSFFVAAKFNAMYGNEERLSKIIGVFCLIAVMLSCFGLLAYIALLIHHRTKEIGIRKINGARVSEIITMLNKDFVKWVAIAFLIATPVAYYTMHNWLQNFAYQTELSWWVFSLAGIIALSIAFLTISWQSWRAATRNPVDALRYE
jgi:putative ABC transport system permease protein